MTDSLCVESVTGRRGEPPCKVVLFPAESSHVGDRWADAMKRVNHYEFYELGHELHAVHRISPEPTLGEAFFVLHQAKDCVKTMLKGDLLELTFCRHEASSLLQAVDSIMQQHYWKPDTTELDESKDWQKEKIPSWTVRGLKRALERLEHNLAAELREAATYYVPRRSIYDTSRLVDAAEAQIPAEVRVFMNAAATKDFHDAGRCLAFDLPTAAGFHVMRAVESVLGDYHFSFIGQRKPLESWNNLIQDLEALRPGATTVPDPKTLRSLRDMKDFDRNPLMHPREALDSNDALNLFNLGTSALLSMTKELAAKAAAGPLLPLEQTVAQIAANA